MKFVQWKIMRIMMDFEAVIEIPKGSFFKYEQNKDTGVLKVDRVLSLPCPYNYGYIKNLPIQADGDPLDVFVITAEPLETLSEVKLKVWGILLCEDNGVEDNKVIAMVEGDHFRDYDYFRTIKFYLEHYKEGFVIKEYKIFNDDILFKNFVEKV